MAIKPPSLGDFVDQISGLLGNSGLKSEADRNLRALVQSALSRLDIVNREEFDTQTEILARTRQRVAELEQELESLATELAAADQV